MSRRSMRESMWDSRERSQPSMRSSSREGSSPVADSESGTRTSYSDPDSSLSRCSCRSTARSMLRDSSRKARHTSCSRAFSQGGVRLLDVLSMLCCFLGEAPRAGRVGVSQARGSRLIQSES